MALEDQTRRDVSFWAAENFEKASFFLYPPRKRENISDPTKREVRKIIIFKKCQTEYILLVPCLGRFQVSFRDPHLVKSQHVAEHLHLGALKTEKNMTWHHGNGKSTI